MRVSASRAALLDGCAYWAREGVAWDETPGRSAKQGDEFHQAIAPVVDPLAPTPDFPPTTKWFRQRMEHATAWIAANRQEGWRAEAAYAYDPTTDTARVLGYNIGRKYKEHGALPHEVCGSTDIGFHAENSDAVFVWDWKTGRTVTESVWPQLSWLGLFAARAHGATKAFVMPLHVTDYGVSDVLSHAMDARELRDTAARVKGRTSCVDDAWPEYGSHCSSCYCPARAACDLFQIRSRESA